MKNSAILLFYLFLSALSAQDVSLPPGFVQVQIADSLNPTAMAFDHHGNLFLAQKDGRILLYNPADGLLPDPVLTITVDDFNERGVVGLALHPDFDHQPWLYVYYTVRDSNFNRLSRFRINGNFAIPGSEQVLFDFDKLSAGVHNGGSLQFGPDGKLYIGTGDGGKSSNSQSLEVTLGKILRLNDDGSIPEDNPFYEERSGKNKAIYAYGLRNPFSMGLSPGNGALYVSDVGQGNFEEVNLILPGKNYGWSLIEGPLLNQASPPDYKDPLYAYPHSQGCAIVGALVYEPEQPNFPATYFEKYFFADYCTGMLRVLDLNGGLVCDTFATGLKQPVAFALNPVDGTLWYLMRSGIGGGSAVDNTRSDNGTLWRVKYTGSGAPLVSVQPKDVKVPVAENAMFNVLVSGTAPIHYQWQKNFQDIPGANAAALNYGPVDINDHGVQFRCIASNLHGWDTSHTATLMVTLNQRPTPQIQLPAANSTYKAGALISFSGQATDPEDGMLAPHSFSWNIDFHHDTHTHPVLTLNGESSGSFVVPVAGETSPNTWFRIHLKVTDSGGLTQQCWQDIFPEKVLVHVKGPAQVPVNVDGVVRPMPYSFESAKRLQHIAQAVSRTTVNDSIYIFQKWAGQSDNGNILNFSAPDTSGLVLRPIYDAYPLGNGTGLHGEYFVDPEFDLDEEPTVLRLDTVINFDWGAESPFPNQIPVNGFTARWSGFVQAYLSDTITFYVKSDDGSRLWVGDSLILNKWVAQASTEHSGKIFLKGGEKTPIRLEYLEIGGGANVSLAWSGKDFAKAIVPKRQLFPIPPYEPATLKGTVWHDLNYNHIPDDGEPRLNNAIVLLYGGADSTLLYTSATNVQGQYKFSGLEDGWYFLRFIAAPEWSSLQPFTKLDASGQTERIYLGNLESRQWDVSFVTMPSAIYGTCFEDFNDNGLKEPDEPGLPQVTVMVFRLADSLLLSAQLTDVAGNYKFNYLQPGQYFVLFSNDLSASNLTPGKGLSSNGRSAPVQLNQSQAVFLPGPFVQPSGQIKGRIWLDENGNFFPDAQENGIPNITVLQYTKDSLYVATRVTDAAGRYWFEKSQHGAFFLLVLSNTAPQPIEPLLGMNAFGQTPAFEVEPGSTTVLDLAFKPISSGVGSVEQSLDYRIYPNPTQHTLYVVWPDSQPGPTHCAVQDLFGKAVNAQIKQESGRLTITFPQSPAGLYVVLLDAEQGRVAYRIVLEK